MILMFLALLAPLHVASGNDVEIQQLNTPLLPVELGKTKIIETKHTFLHYIEILPILKQLNNIEYFYDKLESTFNKTKFETKKNVRNAIINDSFARARYLLTATKNKFDNLAPKNRQKRGLINGLGTVSKWLFGTLDHNDEQKYDTAIKNLQENQNSLAHEIELQTSLSQRLIKHYNTTITKLHENQVRIRDKLEELSQSINNNSKDVYFFVSFSSALDQIILNCHSLINFLDNLENAIMFGHLGTLHSSVVPLTELLKMKSYLTSLYGNQKILEFQNSFNYYQYAGIQVKINDTKIIFAIHLPILIDDDFQTIHIVGLPYQNSIITPEKPYLILGTKFHQFEENPCAQLEGIYLCQKHEEVVADTCIIPIMKAEKSICRTNEAYLTHPIVEEINDRFLLVLPASEPVKVQTNCDKKTLSKIENNSLLKIPKGCSVVIGNATYQNTEEVILGNPLILPKLEDNTMTHNSNDDPPLKLHSINLETIKELQTRTKSLHPTPIRNLHPIIWSTPSLVVGIAVTIGTIWSFCWIKKKIVHNPKEKNNPPTVLFSPKEGGVM